MKSFLFPALGAAVGFVGALLDGHALGSHFLLAAFALSAGYFVGTRGRAE